MALAIYLSVAGPVATVPDSARDLERAARASARQYELVLRRLVPERIGRPEGRRCDEYIGRFCFWYGTPGRPRPPVPPERPEVAEARAVAVREHRRWFAAVPSESRAAGPLVRYLVESDRASEAVAAARAHVWAAGRTSESLLILGLALHYAGDVPGAESAFDSARWVVAPAERRRLDDVGVLLEPLERRRYEGLSEDARSDYESRFWALSDPSVLELGNERRSGHYARHALALVLAEAPRVEGMLRWGRDHEELLLRYGTPTSRQRFRDHPMSLERGVTLVERYDPNNVAFVPPALLTGGLPFPPPPGIRPELERDTARSRYSPLRTPRTRGLDVQVSVFPEADGGVVRVDAALTPDTVAPVAPREPAALLVVLDTLGREVARATASPGIRSDSVTILAAEARVPPGSYIFVAEVRDETTGIAGLARYRVDVPPPSGLALSDLLLTAPGYGTPPLSRQDTALVPIPRLIVAPTQVLGVYAEVSGLEPRAGAARFHVESWIEPVDEASLLGRAARWFGQQLGLVRREPPTRLRWADASPAGEQALFFDVDLAGIGPGLYRLGLTIRDAVTGEERTATRLVRVAAGAPAL